MAILAAVGQSQALDGREAGLQATQQALSQVGHGQPNLGLVVASSAYPIQQVVAGVSSQLGDAPLLGFSTTAGLTANGLSERAVIVGLLASKDIQVRAGWWPLENEAVANGVSLARSEYSSAVQKLLLELQPGGASGVLIVIGDGFQGDAAALASNLEQAAQFERGVGSFPITAGWLAGGELRHAQTFQVGGKLAGSAGLGAALLSGNITAGIGWGLGWRDVGAFARITQSTLTSINTLDGEPASELYSRLLGGDAQDWTQPPLDGLVRLYPWGLERENQQPDRSRRPGGESSYLVRAPLKFEADGSLRMNTTVISGSTAHLLAGSVEGCWQAARRAARQALASLGPQTQPALALVLGDVAWQMLLQAQPGEEVRAVRAELGMDGLPVLGGYTLGQIARSGPSGELELLHQHLLVILLGEKGRAEV